MVFYSVILNCVSSIADFLTRVVNCLVCALYQKKSVHFEDEEDYLDEEDEEDDDDDLDGDIDDDFYARDDDEMIMFPSSHKYGSAEAMFLNCEKENFRSRRYNSRSLTRHSLQFRSTFPIDEPIGGSRVISSASAKSPKPVVRSSTFPVDKKCCDTNKPCKDHGTQNDKKFVGSEFSSRQQLLNRYKSDQVL